MLHRAARQGPPPASAGSDYVVPQRWDAFTAEDHAVWDLLFARQVELLGIAGGVAVPRRDRPAAAVASRACPTSAELNAILEPRTGWRTVAVPGLVPDDIFFAMLRERVFPVGNFIRTREQLDYLEAPDCFHDMFGHIPMLAHHDFAEMVEHVGRLGVAAIAAGEGERVARLYWHSVEFGLAREGGRAEDPRRRPRLELRRGAFQPGERRGRAAALLGRARGATRPTGTTPSSRATWSRNRSTSTIAEVLALTPERLLAIE